jgi:hypothetical protein
MYMDVLCSPTHQNVSQYHLAVQRHDRVIQLGRISKKKKKKKKKKIEEEVSSKGFNRKKDRLDMRSHICMGDVTIGMEPADKRGMLRGNYQILAGPTNNPAG